MTICPTCGEDYYPLPFFSDGETCPYCARRDLDKARRRSQQTLDRHESELAKYAAELERLARWNANADDGGDAA